MTIHHQLHEASALQDNPFEKYYTEMMNHFYHLIATCKIFIDLQCGTLSLSCFEFLSTVYASISQFRVLDLFTKRPVKTLFCSFDCHAATTARSAQPRTCLCGPQNLCKFGISVPLSRMKKQHRQQTHIQPGDHQN